MALSSETVDWRPPARDTSRLHRFARRTIPVGLGFMLAGLILHPLAATVALVLAGFGWVNADWVGVLLVPYLTFLGFAVVLLGVVLAAVTDRRTPEEKGRDRGE